MNRFRELNNNIEDVPMKFSDKYLTLLNNSIDNQLINEDCCDDDDDDDINQFHIEDYKFDNELIAIEMYELYQKQKADKLKAQAAFESVKQPQNHQNVNQSKQNIDQLPNATTPQNDHWKTLRSKSLAEEQKPNLLYNMITSGEILQPQPLMNNNYSSSSPSHAIAMNNTNCDINQQNLLDPLKASNLVNPREFENDDSSPFDNVELQTIDDIKELNKVFGALNLSTEKNTNFQVPRNSPIQTQIDDKINANNHNNETISGQMFPGSLSSNTNHFVGYPNSIYQNNDNSNSYPNSKTTTANHNLFDARIYNSFSTQYAPTTNHNYGSPTHRLTELQNSIQTGNIPIYSNAYYNASNIYGYNQNVSAYPPIPKLNHLALEMKRSSSEKKNFYDPLVTSNHSFSNSRSKSVSDLSKIPSCDPSTNTSYGNNINNNIATASLYDRSKTPPTLPGSNHTLNQPTIAKTTSTRTKKLILTDPYETLSNKQRNFVDHLCQMGFQRDRISRAVKHMDIEDDKKIFEYLLALQQLEDQGYDCDEGEIALHLNNYDKNQAENFLKTLHQICDFGFDKEKSIQALFKTNNDRDKAIEILLKMN